MSRDSSTPETHAATPGGKPPARLWELGLAVVVLAAVIAGYFVFRHREIEDKEADVQPGTPLVAVARVDREDLFNEMTIAAEFRPYVEVTNFAKVSGYVDKMYVDFGDKVTNGQLMATSGVPELQQQLDAAKSAQAHAEADYTNAHLIYTRLSAVIKDHPNLMAQQDVDTAESKDSGAGAALASAKADVAKFQALMDYTRITASFKGVVTSRYVDPGALIQMGTSSDTQARPVVRVSDNYRLRLDFPVSVAYVKDIHVGDKVNVRVQSLNNKLYTGEVTRFTDRVNPETRKMITEIEVPNPDLELVPGMYAEVILKVERRDQALTVPVQAVAMSTPPTVDVVNAAHEIEERNVTIGLETPTRCEVVAGLAEGDLVMIGGRSLVHAGEKVETKEWKAPEVP